MSLADWKCGEVTTSPWRATVFKRLVQKTDNTSQLKQLANIFYAILKTVRT